MDTPNLKVMYSVATKLKDERYWCLRLQENSCKGMPGSIGCNVHNYIQFLCNIPDVQISHRYYL